MANFFADNFSNCVFLAVLLLAMFPMFESKVAIPLALSTAIWGEATMSPLGAFATAFVGSVIPVVFVLWFAKFIKNKTAGFVHEKFMTKFQDKHQKHLDSISLKASTFKKCLAIATFVAIPLPLTGVYTGSLIAGLVDLKFWQGFLSVIVGELLSCAVILVLCVLFENSAFYVLIASLVLVAVFLLVRFSMFLVEKIKARKSKTIELSDNQYVD